MKKKILLFLLVIFLVRPLRVEAVSGFGRLMGKTRLETKLVSRFGQLISSQIEKVVEKVSRALGVDRASSILTVALLGDSMTDVLQPDLPQLKEALGKRFPGTKFKLYNFGVGASNMEYGLYRLTNEYDYLGKHFPSVLSVGPDVLVIESFAYNNFGDTKKGLDKQWLLLGEITTKVKELSPKTKIVLAAAIAPNSSVYGDGIDGIDWPLDQKKARVATVKRYLENLINFAHSQKYPLADAYHQSMDSHGEGKLKYISTADHVHPSGPGGVLFCQQVAETVRSLY